MQTGKILRAAAAKFVLFSRTTLALCRGDAVAALVLSAVQGVANPEKKPVAPAANYSQPFSLADADLVRRTGLALSTVRKQKRMMVERPRVIASQMRLC